MPEATLENPGKSPIMRWIREHLDYQGDDCLIWPFGKRFSGYGFLMRGGKTVSAHRYICALVNGPDPGGHDAAHSCGRGHDACVHPRHLSWKTPSQNQRERADGGKGNRKRCKLTPDDAATIRAAAGVEKIADTAKRFNVTQATVRNIQIGKYWKTEGRARAFDLTAEQAAAILRLKGVKPQKEIAKEFGVGLGVVGRIHCGATYSHAIRSLNCT